MEKPTVTELAGKAGISKSYACEILGERVPSMSLAIRVFRTTGWRHAILETITDEQIDLLESIDPWVPLSERPDKVA